MDNLFNIDPIANYNSTFYDYQLDREYNEGVLFNEELLMEAVDNGPYTGNNIFKKLWDLIVRFIKWIGSCLVKIKNFLFGTGTPKANMNAVMANASAKSSTIIPNPAIVKAANTAISGNTSNTSNNSNTSNSNTSNTSNSVASQVQQIIPGSSVNKNGVVSVSIPVISNNGSKTSVTFSAMLNPVKLVFENNKPKLSFYYDTKSRVIHRYDWATTSDRTLDKKNIFKLSTVHQDVKNPTNLGDSRITPCLPLLIPKSKTFDLLSKNLKILFEALSKLDYKTIQKMYNDVSNIEAEVGKALVYDAGFSDYIVQLTSRANNSVELVEIPIDIPLIQGRIEEISKYVELARDFDISKLEDAMLNANNSSINTTQIQAIKAYIIEFMKELTDSLVLLQLAFNQLMTKFNGSYHIDASYYGSIHTKEDLAIMADEVVKAGIPTKWAYNNIVLACDDDLRGEVNAYDPAIGHSRVVMFPKNEGNNVLKVAGNRMGLDANRSEYNASSQLIVKYPELGDLLAKVNWIADNGTVLTMEKGLEGYPDSDDVNAVKSQVNDILRKHGENIQFSDIHSGNVMYFAPSRQKPKIIDYGMQS